MNKLYFGLPLVIVVAFFVFFQYSYVPEIRAEEAKIVAQKKIDEAKRKEEDRLRTLESQRVLIEDSERRKAVRIAREEKERIAKEARDALKERFEKARGEIGSFERDNRRLEVEIEAEKELVERAKAEQASHEKEKAFLREYISQAENNAKRMQALLEQINKVEAARAAAALAAAATAKGGNN